MKNKITFTLTSVPDGYRSIWGDYAFTSSDRTRHCTQSQLDAAKLLKVKCHRDVVGSFSLIN